MGSGQRCPSHPTLPLFPGLATGNESFTSLQNCFNSTTVKVFLSSPMNVLFY